MASQDNIVHLTPINALPPLRIGVFFDGTGNNDDNDSKFSNVKYLYDMYLGDDESLIQKKYNLRKFYQRGVGSHEDDSFTEAGMGTGGGKRFNNVIFNIEDYISTYRDKGYDGHLPQTILIDVFGFSRGAAMARHFVNCIKQNYFDFKDPDINKAFSNSNINIGFLGVFDTVGSFGIAGDNIDDGYSFYIDPSWIVNKAVHIYALNEYRWGFDLQALFQQQDTNYPIDIVDEKLIEIGLPGVHSDIGGGYIMNELEQFCDNSLLACMALETMAKHASENDVPLDADYKDASRRSISCSDKSFADMQTSFNDILPFMLNNDLRRPIGLWREHIALLDIYLIKLEKANAELNSAWKGDDDYEQLKSDIYNLEKSLQKIQTKITLNEKALIEEFNNLEEFNRFKSSYDVLYQKYMHRSHSPFNTTPFMGKEDADENFWLWNKTISDERPHRDIFYNQFKDFEKLNNSKKRVGSRGSTKPAAEFYPLQSEFWNDKTRG